MGLADKNPMWRPPKHHQDLPDAHDHVHWMELFYDLIHVVMIFLLGNYLSHHHDMAGFIAFVMIFVAMWLAWGETSVYNSLYVSTDWIYRLCTAFQTLSVMFMAASIPAIEPSLSDPGKGFTYFAAAYGMNRLILGLMYFRAAKSKVESTSLAHEQALRFILLSILFFVAAFLSGATGVLVFVAGVVITQFFYFIPKLTIMRLERFAPRMGHFTERFALLLLIVNGEGFFKLVVTLSEKGIYKVGPEVLFNVSFGGLAVFALTWIYFDFVGNYKIRKGNRYLYMIWLGHMLLMLAAVMIGVALAGEVYVGFMEPYPVYYGTLGCLGLVLYLFSIFIIQCSVEPQAAHRFANPKVLFAAIGLSLLCFATFRYMPAIFGNLLWASAIILVLPIQILRAYKVLSREHAD